MNDLIEIIDEIVKYGLNPNVEIVDKDKDLEKNLVKLYAKYFEFEDYEFEGEHRKFDKSRLPNIQENILSNFPEFGFYHEVLDLNKIAEKAEYVLGDSIDDLGDIIFDLLEVKWIKENGNENDALWFFEFIFRAHTQQHLIDLLKFMKSRN